MGNQYDDQDEDMDDLEADGNEDGAEVEEPEDEAEAEPRAASGGGGAAKSAEGDSPEERTVSSRQAQRDEMTRQIEEFLARGGKIKEIDPNVTADPPRKPESEYGSRPI